MAVNPIDPELDFYIGALESSDESEEPDAFSKLFETGAIAAQLGGDQMAHTRAERLQNEIADIDAHIFKRRTAPAASDWDTEIIPDDSHALAKMESSSARQKRNLSAWISSQLALNKDISALVEHAQRYDPATARLIREIGEELEAA